MLRACARKVIECHQSSLPDLSNLVILLPHTILAPRLRQYLLTLAESVVGSQSLLPPLITTPKELFRQATHRKHASHAECKMLLGSALHNHSDLLIDRNCWETADSMLALFNEIDEYNITYNTPLALHEESEKLGSIHNAWKEILATEDSENSAYIQTLLKNQLTPNQKNIFICGFDSLTPAEQYWLDHLDDTQSTIIGYSDEPTHIGSFLSLAINQNGYETLQERVNHQLNQSSDSPVSKRISIFNPENLEQHAFGIQTKIIELINNGTDDIAVVTQDRKFARRLRALLNREKILVRDYSGWALSTTSSASALFQLIPSTTKGFNFESLLNILYSPYCSHELSAEELKNQRTGIGRILAKSSYITGSFEEILDCINPLGNESSSSVGLIKHLIETLQPLEKLCGEKTEKSLGQFFTRLLGTMEKLGILQNFQHDPAGEQIINLLHKMQSMAEKESLKDTWSLWRSWIIDALEKEGFVPDKPGTGVTFYNWKQSVLLHAQVIILASVDRRYDQITGAKMLLTDTSLQQLNLKTRDYYQQLSRSRLHRLLDSGEQIIVTHQSRDGNHALTAAPWLEQLQNFHELVYNDNLLDSQLSTIATHQMHTLSVPLEAPLPEPAVMPKPHSPSALWPKFLSASAYQSAVNCPYQFFAKHCLNLRELKRQPDEYSGSLSYGNIIHRCLNTLHDKMRNPGDLDKSLTLAAQIIDAEFAGKDSKSYAANWRMSEARKILSAYIHWLIKEGLADSKFTNELTVKSEIDGIPLQGRIDCLIEQTNSVSVVDYKTGAMPSKIDIAKGEDVQIGFYTLLRDEADQAMYLQLKPNQSIRSTGVDDKTTPKLSELKSKHRQRLTEFKHAYDKQMPLPAWAKQSICNHCDYSGICRRPAWRA